MRTISKQKERLLVLLLACLMFCFTACSPFAQQSLNDLLRAPALGQGQGEIQNALALYLGEEPEYKYPKEGDWRSPLMVADLDGDGRDEGVLLYSLVGSTAAGKGSNVYIAILQQQGEKWTVVQDIEGGNTEVTSFELLPLPVGKRKQLLIGFSPAGTAGANKILSLYAFSDNTVSMLQSLPYDYYQVADFSGNGQNDLVMVYSEEGLNMLFVPMSDSGLEFSQTAVKLNANYATCVGIYPSQTEEGDRLMVVDGTDNNKMLASEIFHYSADGGYFYTYEELKNVFYEASRVNFLLTSRDINDDGIVEIPVRIGLDPVLTVKNDKRLEYVKWMDFTRPEEPVQFGIVDSAKAVYIRLPDVWLKESNTGETRGPLRVVDGADAGEWSIENTRTGQELLTMRIKTGSGNFPVDAIRVSPISDAYLQVSSTVQAAQRQQIEVTSLS